MKQFVFYALAAGLVLSTGCSKKEETPPTPPPAMPPAMVQITGEVAVVTAQAQAITKEVSQKTQDAVKALTVKPEAVMAELNQPVTDIKAKAANYGKPELLAYANAYKDIIVAKKDQLAGLSTQLKRLGMADILGEKGIAIKDQLTQYTSQLAGLKERYEVYLDMLKKFGVDLSSFGL